MSSPVAVASSAASKIQSATNPFAALAANGVNGGSASGLFLNLLGIKPLSSQSGLETPNAASVAISDTLGKSGFNFETALLVLPQGIANLSESDLKLLVENATQNADGTFTNKLLVSLTPGTPAAEAIAKFLSQFSQSSQSSKAGTETITNMALVTSSQEASAQGQILLVATNLSPSDMEKLKAALSEQGNTIIDMADNLDGTDATDATAVALVMFAPPSLVPQISESKANMDLGLNVKSSATENAENAISALHPNLGKYTSSASSSDMGGEDNILGLQYGFSAPDASGFKGSLATQSEKNTAQSEKNDIAGKIDSSANISTSLLFKEWNTSGASTITTDSLSTLGNGATSATAQGTLTNPIINNGSASAAHPATQMVAAMLEKSAEKSDKKQTLTIQLDPPELGRVQVQLSYEKGEAMKVHLLAETKDTLTLLQRDSHALRSALEQAGIQTDSASLSFDMANSDQSFNQMLGQFQDGRSNQQRTAFSLEQANQLDGDLSLPALDTTMNFIPDAATGTIRYSLLV